MPTVTCDACGASLKADDEGGLIEAAHDHFTAAHKEFGAVTRVQTENWLDAVRRTDGRPTERLDVIGAVEVVPATPERRAEVLDFFDHDAFAGNPGWGSCYCLFHHVGEGDSPPWDERTAAHNRQELAANLEHGRTRAWLAYVDGRLAGWVNASDLRYLNRHRDEAEEHGGDVAAVVCFAIAPPYRGHGLARRLLDAAVEGARQRGAKAVIAHPPKDPRSAAAAYPGPRGLYEEAGFEAIGEGEHHVVMRKPLV